MPEVGFEPTHPKITELKSAALDHSAIQAFNVTLTTTEGFEPPRADPSDFESDALTTRPCCLQQNI